MLLGVLEPYLTDDATPRDDGVSGFPPYTYSALPTPTSIRLLKLRSDPAPEIQCSLHLADLHDPPRYDALSYIWGDPRDPIFQTIAPGQYRRRYEVICDHRTIVVAENLYHALQKLKSMKSRKPTLTDGSTVSDYVWIDAICVNQQDTAERGSQVAVMDQIYVKSHRVIAWLGKMNQYTDRAVKLVRNPVQGQTASKTSMLGGLLRALNLNSSRDPNAERAGKPQSNLNDDTKILEPLVALFQLPYFRRAWVVQELALAPGIVLIWGDHMIPWEELAECATRLTQPGVASKLVFTSSYFESAQDHMNSATVKPLAGGIGAISAFRNRSVMYSGMKIPWYALAPINMGRSWQCTDPRDRIFSTLGIVKAVIRDCPPSEPVRVSMDDLPIPDYTKSTEQVYTEFAIWQMNVTKTLFPVAIVEDRSRRNPAFRDTLPSWVPDFSVPLQPMPMFFESNHPWCADGPENTASPLPLEGGLLVIRGAFFDRVHNLADPMEFPFSKECISSILRLIEPLVGSAYPSSPMGYIDALWRTLTLDYEMSPTAERVHPADPNRRQDFNEWVVSRASFFAGSKIDTQNSNSRRYYKVQSMLLEEITFQAWQDPTIFSHNSLTDEEYALRLGFEEFQKDAFRLRRDASTEWIATLKDFILSYRNLLIREPHTAPIDIGFMQNAMKDLAKPSTPSGKALYDRINAFRLAVEKAGNCRRLFVTANGYIGLGPRSLQPGDEVWIVSGLGTPSVLRPSRTGRFRWIGEAYVHGIMHGEAVQSGRLKFHEIDLE